MGEYDRALSEFQPGASDRTGLRAGFHRPRTDVRTHRRFRARQVRIPHRAVDQRKLRPGRYFQIRPRNRGSAACGAVLGCAAADDPSSTDQGILRDFGADARGCSTRGGARRGQGDRGEARPPGRADHRQLRLQIGGRSRKPAPRRRENGGTLRAIGFDDVTIAIDVTREKMIEALRSLRPPPTSPTGRWCIMRGMASR